jgi:very-short-patch-repair endonuclease
MWTVIASRVYVVFPADHWHQNLMAACLWGGEDARASHRSAAALWQLDGVARGALDVTLTSSRRAPFNELRIHVTRTLVEMDLGAVGPIPVTSVTRTLIDLGSVVDPDGLEEALDCALRRRQTTVPRLRWRLRQLGTRGRPGAAKLNKLLAERPTSSRPTESALEVRLSRLLRQADLPTPVQQYEILDGARVVARCDFAYPAAKLAIEADGYAFHSGKLHWQADLTRRTRLAQLGWRVIHVTDDDARTRPHEVIEWIRRALGGEHGTFLL